MFPKVRYVLISGFVLVLVFGAFMSHATVQATQLPSVPSPTPIPLPTRPHNPPFWSVFPANLYCYDVSLPYEGPTWGEITVGSSGVEDLKDYVDTIGNYTINQWADYISFARTGSFQAEMGIPSIIASCVAMDTQIITALSVSTNSPLFLKDLVAELGVPDAVTWGSGSIFRTVFWFAEGIAASVNIVEHNRMLDYGQISFVVYFPYQTEEGFEERWPYSRTNSESPTGGDRVYDPPPSEDKNPFDFEAMIATLTAEPSRTPTPTLPPRPTNTMSATSSPSATATPPPA